MIKMFVYTHRKSKRIKANEKQKGTQCSLVLCSHLLISACCLLDCFYIIIWEIFFFCFVSIQNLSNYLIHNIYSYEYIFIIYNIKNQNQYFVSHLQPRFLKTVSEVYLILWHLLYILLIITITFFQYNKLEVILLQ